MAKGTITTMSCNPATNGFRFTEDYVTGQGGEELSMFNGSGNWQRSNVFGAAKLLATYDNDGLHFYLDDPLGSRRVQTDYEGVVERTCASLPFGDGETCAPTPTEHLFTGKERDAESGNDYFGARYYASTMGRFMSPDPSGGHTEDPQTLNKYSYVANNPLIRTDPTGLDFYLRCTTKDHSGCTQVQTDPKNQKSTARVQSGKDGKATIITSDSIRAGQNTATVDIGGVKINGSNTGIYFDNAASHTTDANGNDVNHNPIDLAGSGTFNGFSFRINGNCGGTCLASGLFSYPSMHDATEQVLWDRGAYRSIVDRRIPGWGQSPDEYEYHPGTEQFRFGNGPSPHFSVPDNPKFSIPTIGPFHVDTDAPGIKHLACATTGGRMRLDIVIYLGLTAMLVMSVLGWFKTDRHHLSQLRNVVFFAAVLLSFGASTLFLAFWIHSGRIGGFGNDVPALLRWTVPGFWISALSTVLCFVGRGRSRILSCAVAAVVFTAWVLANWAS